MLHGRSILVRRAAKTEWLVSRNKIQRNYNARKIIKICSTFRSTNMTHVRPKICQREGLPKITIFSLRKWKPKLKFVIYIDESHFNRPSPPIPSSSTIHFLHRIWRFYWTDRYWHIPTPNFCHYGLASLVILNQTSFITGTIGQNDQMQIPANIRLRTVVWQDKKNVPHRFPETELFYYRYMYCPH